MAYFKYTDFYTIEFLGEEKLLKCFFFVIKLFSFIKKFQLYEKTLLKISFFFLFFMSKYNIFCTYNSDGVMLNTSHFILSPSSKSTVIYFV